jgi:hypothetical protein
MSSTSEPSRRGDANSKVEDGVYVRRKDGRVEAVQIHLNTASEADGNGINLAPATPLPEPESGRLSLFLTARAVRRLHDAVEGGR